MSNVYGRRTSYERRRRCFTRIRDADGWTALSPKPVVGTTQAARVANAEVGSRLMYIKRATGQGLRDTAGTPATAAQLDADAAAELYFWDGTAECIIDEDGNTAPTSGPFAGVAYGTDPFQPSASVKKFATWGYCGPRNDGRALGASGAGSVGSERFNGGSPGRLNKPDWWLFERGDSYSILDDVLEYVQRTTPAATKFDVRFYGLGLPGSADATYPQVMGAWGNPTLARPRFYEPGTNGFFKRTQLSGEHTLQGICYLSLHFDGTDRSLGYAWSAGFKGQTGTNAIRVEDVWCDGGSGGVSLVDSAEPPNATANGDVTMFRCLITDQWAQTTTHVLGNYQHGEVTSKVRYKECVWARNGFSMYPRTQPTHLPSEINATQAIGSVGVTSIANNGTTASVITTAAHGIPVGYTGYVAIRGDPDPLNNTETATVTVTSTTTFTYPSTAGVRAATAGARFQYFSYNPFTRNLYLGGLADMTNMVIEDCIMLIGGSSEQLRPGGFIRRNFIYSGGMLNGGGQGTAQVTPDPSGCYDDNVLQVFRGGVSAHSGLCFIFGASHMNASCRRNIITDEGEPAANHQHIFLMDWTDGNLKQTSPSSGIMIEDNVAWMNTGATSAFHVRDGKNPVGTIAGVETSPTTATFTFTPAFPAGATEPLTAWDQTLHGASGHEGNNNKFVGTYGATVFTRGLGASGGTLAQRFTESGNTTYASKAAATAANPTWIEPTRNMKTVMEDVFGLTVSSYNGYGEFMDWLFTNKPQKGNGWDSKMNGKTWVNHVREGFGMAELA